MRKLLVFCAVLAALGARPACAEPVDVHLDDSHEVSIQAEGRAVTISFLDPARNQARGTFTLSAPDWAQFVKACHTAAETSNVIRIDEVEIANVGGLSVYRLTEPSTGDPDEKPDADVVISTNRKTLATVTPLHIRQLFVAMERATGQLGK